MAIERVASDPADPEEEQLVLPNLPRMEMDRQHYVLREIFRELDSTTTSPEIGDQPWSQGSE
jgi:hypothetical protein